ncbi:MAG: ATP-binding protein, partial [Gammaproteobacteria bacterium]|nr:ATP-binding protein [Gammaproteobacteria bacterium]
KQHLASVIGISIERLNDIVSDLPGMRLLDDKVGFLDEDIEAFVREKAQPRLPEVNLRVANYFYDHHESDEYAAMHLAGALFSAGQGQKIIEIIEQNEAATAIKDQIIRREVQRQRLQLAMKVCRSAGQPADAIFTLLVGAEAIKTDEAVDKIIIENPELSVHFAQDTVGRNILYSSKMYEKHGRFLSHIIARDANDKDFIAAREKQRIFREWMGRRSDDMARQKVQENEYRHQHIEPWPIELKDIAAVAHSVLDMQGYQAAYDYICGWKPRGIHFEIALILINRLLTSGKADIVQAFLDSGVVPEPWSSLFSTPLALAGYTINCATLERALCHKKVLKYCDLKDLNMSMSEEGSSTRYIEVILTGCEILAANGEGLSSVESILESLCPDEWRRINNIYTHDSLKNDIGFRAFSLLKRHQGSDVTIETYWIEPPAAEDVDKTEKHKQKQKLAEKRKELKENLSGLMNIYAVRADILLSNIPLEDVEKMAKSALRSLSSNAWRLSREHHFDAICDRLSLTIGKLSIVPNLDRKTVLELTKLSFKEWPAVFSNGQRRAIAFLIKIPPLRQYLVRDIYDRSNEVKELKTAASEKISILLDLSRILLFVDRDEAREVFKMAVDIASDVDVDAMHEVSLFYALAGNAKDHFSQSESRQIAADMAAITTEYGTLLDGYDHFPWGDAMSAIATLHMSKAISLIGYWEDCGLSPASDTIPSLISVGTKAGTIKPAQAVSLLDFCDDLDVESLTTLTSVANLQGAAQLIEEVSRAELLRFNRIGRAKICQTLNELISYNTDSGYWHSALNQQVQFRSENNKKIKANVEDDTFNSKDNRAKEKEFLEAITLADISFESPPDFIESMKLKQGEARKDDIYISCDDIIKMIANRWPSENRINFLNLLADERVIDGIGYTWAKNLISCVDLWLGCAHAIAAWKEENLPPLIAEYLGEFTYSEGYGYDKSMLVDVLDNLNLDQGAIVNLLLDGLERNANTLPLSKLYTVLGLLAGYCKGAQVADVTTRYIQRLTTRLKLANNTTDLECSVVSAMAHQLYSFLGDVDTRVRWRAAHSIRASVRMGDLQVIVALTSLYDSKDMPGYREDKMPFYWLSARLWLVITFDRVTSEVPEAIVPIARWLLGIATDQDFPHVLMRHFAKSCLTKLLSDGDIDFNDQEVAAVHAINASALGTEKSKRRISRGGFHEGGKDRKFRFDSLDTLRYVYPRAIECFSGVDEEKFLDEAETWIIDRWEKGSGLSEWKNEPRKYQFERADYTLYSHSHGGMPTIERHSYYLEWHAMWCSVGSLMRSEALAEPKYDDGDYGTFNGLLRRDGLTQPPHWSSDLRCPTPLELRFRYPPDIEPEEWVASIEAYDFELEFGLTSDENILVIDSYHDIRTNSHRTSVRISSALVNPDTSLSLVRALQTSDDSHDYRLPPVGHDLEIDDDPYKLRGWISEYSSDPRLDQKDTFNHGVRMIESAPSKNVIEVLGLRRSGNYPVSWIGTVSGDKAFIYEVWGDVRDDSRQKEYIFDEEVISDGHRLKVSTNSLNHYLGQVGFDLIVNVEIERRVSKDGITKYDQESKKEARYTRLYLLRRTGEI